MARASVASALKAAITKLTSGCIAVPPERLAVAIETKLANAEQPDDDADVHDAAQRVAVALPRRQRQCRGGGEAIGGLGRGEPDLRRKASRRLPAAKQPAMRLAAPEAALGEPGKARARCRHRLDDQRLRRIGDAAAGLDAFA